MVVFTLEPIIAVFLIAYETAVAEWMRLKAPLPSFLTSSRSWLENSLWTVNFEEVKLIWDLLYGTWRLLQIDLSVKKLKLVLLPSKIKSVSAFPFPTPFHYTHVSSQSTDMWVSTTHRINPDSTLDPRKTDLLLTLLDLYFTGFVFVCEL